MGLIQRATIPMVLLGVVMIEKVITQKGIMLKALIDPAETGTDTIKLGTMLQVIIEWVIISLALIRMDLIEAEKMRNITSTQLKR